MRSDRRWLNGVRIVALFEAAKAGLGLLSSATLLTLMHRDVPAVAVRLVHASRLDPAGRVSRLLLNTAAHVTDSRLALLAGFAGAYAAVRSIEAYGLWHERRWAEWFALVSGALYVPVEIYELLQRVSWSTAAILCVNLGVVAYMARALAPARAVARRRD